MSLILNEISHLHSIDAQVRALVEFSLSLFPQKNLQFIKKESEQKFVMHPDNFVTFTICYKNKNHARISVRGYPYEFDSKFHEELPLKRGMNGYSEFTYSKASQLAAAAYYIKRASSLYDQGRNRTRRTPITIE